LLLSKKRDKKKREKKKSDKGKRGKREGRRKKKGKQGWINLQGARCHATTGSRPFRK